MKTKNLQIEFIIPTEKNKLEIFIGGFPEYPVIGDFLEISSIMPDMDSVDRETYFFGDAVSFTHEDYMFIARRSYFVVERCWEMGDDSLPYLQVFLDYNDR